ncbi:unnamed protein product, partial [Chrysoparadoxa australica]
QKRRFCSAHKTSDMVDVKSNMCKHLDGCTRHALYAMQGDTPQFCSLHKAPGMVDVKKRRRCSIDDCGRRASYNMVTERRPLFCCQHKLP